MTITFLPIQPADELSFTCPASFFEYLAADVTAVKRRADWAIVSHETPPRRSTRDSLVNQIEDVIIKITAVARMAREDDQ